MTQNTHKTYKRKQESEQDFFEQSHHGAKYNSQNTPVAAGFPSEPGTYFQGFIRNPGSESSPRIVDRALYDFTPHSSDVEEQEAEQKKFLHSNTRRRGPRPVRGQRTSSSSSTANSRKFSALPWMLVTAIMLILALLYLQSSIGVSQHDAPYKGIDHSVPIFAIVGKTGAGKSQFIEVLGGRHIEDGRPPQVGHTLESCTQGMPIYKAVVNDEPVYLMDTPGFDDSEKTSDSQILQDIFSELSDLYKNQRLLSGIIYLHDISQPRIGGLAINNLNMFEHLCGKSALRNVALVTTKWRKRPTPEESRIESQREGDLIEKYWKDMKDQGSYVERHDGSATSGRRIITMLRDRPMMVPRSESFHVKRQFEETSVRKGTSRGDKEQGKEKAPDPSGKSKTSRGWKVWLYWGLGVIVSCFILVVLMHYR